MQEMGDNKWISIWTDILSIMVSSVCWEWGPFGRCQSWFRTPKYKKCVLGRDSDRAQWPRPNIIIQFRTRYQFHVRDEKTIRSSNCLQTVWKRTHTVLVRTCRARRCCAPSPRWRSSWRAGGWRGRTTGTRTGPGSSGPRLSSPAPLHPETTTLELRGRILKWCHPRTSGILNEERNCVGAGY